MLHRRAWRIRDDRGSLAIEFALMAPVFMLLVLAVVDLGMAALELSNIRSAARAGLQAVLADADNVADASNVAETAAPAAQVSVTTTCICPDGTEIVCGDTCSAGVERRIVTVSVTRDLPLLVPWPGMKDPLPLTGLARARVE